MSPDPSRANALRRSILDLMETADRPHYAHPMFWAPFIVVGAGGAAMGALIRTNVIPSLPVGKLV